MHQDALWENTMKTRIAIAEDNSLLAASIQEKLLLFAKDFEFVFHAIDGHDLLKKLSDNHRVDVILMDIEMPGMDGIEATGLIRQQYPQIRIIMLTVFDDDEKIFRAIRAGAMGYLLKDEPPEKIHEGIKMTMKGGAAMSPSIAARTLALLRQPDLASEKSDADAAEVTLTRREVEVVEQLSQGLEYRQIAANLFISPATVRKHIENIYDKLHVHNKIEAVKKAQQYRII